MMLTARRFHRSAITLPLLAGALLVPMPEARAQVTPTTITYQGRLTLSGTEYTGTATITMTLYDAVTNGNKVGGPITFTNVNVTDGVFTVTPDFGAAAFTGNVDYVEVSVTTPSGGGPKKLSPRQPLTAAPLALALPYFQTIPAVDSFSNSAPNLLGGAPSNTIATGIYAATISGGESNSVGAGGYFATVGGGGSNNASGNIATIGGGGNNSAIGEEATIGGGYNNNASAWATVGGGVANTASGEYATVGGGSGNNASGGRATIPGGVNNTAAGSFSFAAGYSAQANHDGAFVWADDAGGPAFASTSANQFLIRAAGGVGIGTNSPEQSLTLMQGMNVDQANANTGNPPSTGSQLWPGIKFGSHSGEGMGSERTAGVNQYGLDFYTSFTKCMSITHAGSVGIGTSAPDQALSVVGNASKTGGGSWATFSDARLKHDLRPMTGTLDKLLSLRGFTFAYNPDAVAQGRGLPGIQIGLVAQEVEQVFPDWVSTSPDGFKMVTERATTALMVEALRDLRNEKDVQLDAQRAEIETVKHDNADKQREIDALQTRLAALEAQIAKVLEAKAGAAPTGR